MYSEIVVMITDLGQVLTMPVAVLGSTVVIAAALTTCVILVSIVFSGLEIGFPPLRCTTQRQLPDARPAPCGVRGQMGLAQCLHPRPEIVAGLGDRQ